MRKISRSSMVVAGYRAIEYHVPVSFTRQHMHIALKSIKYLCNNKILQEQHNAITHTLHVCPITVTVFHYFHYKAI